jgi:cytoskeletal protein CcmA (bactofilin family)
VTGNIYAAKLQIETNANFNGQCHMTTASGAPAKSASGNSINEQKSEKSVVADTTFSLK